MVFESMTRPSLVIDFDYLEMFFKQRELSLLSSQIITSSKRQTDILFDILIGAGNFPDLTHRHSVELDILKLFSKDAFRKKVISFMLLSFVFLFIYNSCYE